MSSVNGLLTPNNFKIFAESVTTNHPGGDVTPDSNTVFTNKTLVDSSNFITSEAIWVNGKTHTVVIGGGIPLSNQALVSTTPNDVEFQTVVLPTVAQTLENKTITNPNNNVAATSLLANGGASVIDVKASPDPVVGKVLKANSTSTAIWDDIIPNTLIFDIPVYLGTAGVQEPFVSLDFGSLGFPAGVYRIEAKYNWFKDGAIATQQGGASKITAAIRNTGVSLIIDGQTVEHTGIIPFFNEWTLAPGLAIALKMDNNYNWTLRGSYQILSVLV